MLSIRYVRFQFHSLNTNNYSFMKFWRNGIGSSLIFLKIWEGNNQLKNWTNLEDRKRNQYSRFFYWFCNNTYSKLKYDKFLSLISSWYICAYLWNVCIVFSKSFENFWDIFALKLFNLHSNKNINRLSFQILMGFF